MLNEYDIQHHHRYEQGTRQPQGTGGALSCPRITSGVCEVSKIRFREATKITHKTTGPTGGFSVVAVLYKQIPSTGTRFLRKAHIFLMVFLAEEFRSPILAQRGPMPIDMTLPWYCKQCRREMSRKGDILICSNPGGPCGSVLPTDSRETAFRAVLSPLEMRDELSEMASRAAHVEAVAHASALPSEHPDCT